MAAASYTKILFVGDMHLGQRPSIPELEDSQTGLTTSMLGPRAAWEIVVERAVAEEVDAVALAGDLVEGDDDLFEARALLETGIKKLTAAGIAVCAVAGNHDTLIMPILTESIPDLKLLGPQGQWSEFRITGQGAEVRLVGWSFPGRHHATSPLTVPPPPPQADLVTLGLLHCDLGSQRSPYAPVSAAELGKTGYQAWFLGHIHQPGLVPSFDQLPATPFYLGSITGVDRTETGIHGPVLVMVGKDGSLSGRRLPLAPLHWDQIEVPVDSVFRGPENDPWDRQLRNHLMATLNTLPHWGQEDLDHIQVLGLSITLTGKVQEPHRVVQAMEQLQQSENPLFTLVDGRAVFIRKLSSAVTGQVDLQKLALREDPPGLLARQILVLRNPAASFPWVDNPATEAKRLIALGRQELQRVASETTRQALFPETSEPDDAAISDLLISTGSRLLDGLLAQEGSAVAPA